MSEIEIKIKNGAVISIAETTFNDILENEYGGHENLTTYYQSRYIKDLILEMIPHAKCVPQKDEMNCIFKAAKIIRSIFEFRKNKTLTLGNDSKLSDEDVTAEHFSLIK